MTADSKSRRPKDKRERDYTISNGWVANIIQAVTAAVTGVLTVVVAIVVTIMVLLGGLWLAYVYLPLNIFYIILAVLLADIVLGIVIRSVTSPK